jgi:hypothetical protein
VAGTDSVPFGSPSGKPVLLQISDPALSRASAGAVVTTKQIAARNWNWLDGGTGATYEI